MPTMTACDARLVRRAEFERRLDAEANRFFQAAFDETLEHRKLIGKTGQPRQAEVEYRWQERIKAYAWSLVLEKPANQDRIALGCGLLLWAWYRRCEAGGFREPGAENCRTFEEFARVRIEDGTVPSEGVTVLSTLYA